MGGLTYPVYIPSRGRPTTGLTAPYLEAWGVPYRLVVEPHEFNTYALIHGEDRLLELPDSNRGIAYSRSWIKDHAISEGHKRHWQFDDNIRAVKRWHDGKRITATTELPDTLAQMEQFVDRYRNVAIAGMQHVAFGFDPKAPFSLNRQVYCAVLVMNDTPHRWRGDGGWEDTDYSLQVLTDGWCTILFHAFQIDKAQSSSMAGGLTDKYEQDDGRLKRAKALQQAWPGLVEVRRMWGRPQQDLGRVWRKFDNRLERV